MKLASLSGLLRQNPYPGRGIVLGRSDNGKNAVIAYFLTGRSENSRNRIFVPENEGLRTAPFDPSKVTDPSLIIYWPLRVLERQTIVTNGDQTDTIYEALSQGKRWEEALEQRTFEPDAPNYTPRISGLLTVKDGKMDYSLSILKTDNGDPRCPLRFFFSYGAGKDGEGRFLHTYRGNGDPLPSFEGEPELVSIEGSIDVFTELVWDSLDHDNRVSLFVRMIDLSTGAHEDRIVNRHSAQSL